LSFVNRDLPVCTQNLSQILVDDQNPPSPQLEAKTNEVEPKVDEVKSKQNNWMRIVNTWRSKTKLKTASNVQGVLL
jgi:hypothetical protein